MEIRILSVWSIDDGLNRKTSTIYPDAAQSHEDAAYDRMGDRVRRTDCNGAVTDYDYDFRNRLKLVSYMDGAVTCYRPN